MNDNGYVYVLMNPSMKNLVKIGKSTRDPESRAKELSSTTGVPTPFVLVYDCYFENCTKAENYVHTYLESKGYRLSKTREFFEIPIKEAIDAVLKAKGHYGEFNIQENNKSSVSFDNNMKIKEPYEELFELADRYYYGLNIEIQDYSEALRLYNQAMKLGSLKAYSMVGHIYYYGKGVGVNENMGLKYLKEGARKDSPHCYAELAKISDNTFPMFNDDSDIYSSESADAQIFYKKYLKLINYDDIDYKICEMYIINTLNCNLNLEYIDKLLIVKDKILNELQKQYDYYEGFELPIALKIENEFINKNIINLKNEIEFINKNIINPSNN